MDHPYSVDVSMCSRVTISYRFSFNQPWQGDGNMNLAGECTNGCAQNPNDPQDGGCNECWDFMYGHFGYDSVQTVLHLMAGPDQNGSREIELGCTNGAQSLDFSFRAQNWGETKENTITDIVVLCFDADTVSIQPIAAACPDAEIELVGSVSGSPARIEWTSTMGAQISNPDQLTTSATSVSEGELFILTSYDVNNCSQSDTVQVSTISAGPSVEIFSCETTVNLFEHLDSLATLGGLFFDVNGELIPEGIITIPPTQNAVMTEYRVGGNSCPVDQADYTISYRAFDIEIETQNAACLRDGSGQLDITELSPDDNYVLTLGEVDYTISEAPHFIAFPPDDYSGLIRNEHCETEIQFSIDGLTLEDYRASVDDAFNITISPTTDIDSIRWKSPSSLSCLDCLDPAASPTVDTIYTGTVYYNGGCSDTVQVFVKAPEPFKDYYLPNVFNPKGSRNNLFKVIPSTFADGLVTTMVIYDRWGNEVFSIENGANSGNPEGWDGTIKDKYVAPGVYLYRVTITEPDGDTVEKLGTLTVIY